MVLLPSERTMFAHMSRLARRGGSVADGGVECNYLPLKILPKRYNI